MSPTHPHLARIAPITVGRSATSASTKNSEMTYRTGRYKMPEMPTLNPFGHAKRLLVIEQTIDLMQSELETGAARILDLSQRITRYQDEVVDLKEVASHEVRLRRDAEGTLSHYEDILQKVRRTFSLPTDSADLSDLVAPAARALSERFRGLEQAHSALVAKLERVAYPSFIGSENEDKLQHVLDRLSLLEMENEDLRQADDAHRSILQTLEQRKSQRISMRRPAATRVDSGPALPLERKTY